MSKNDYVKKFDIEQVKGYVNSINWDKRLKKEIPFLTNLFKKHDFHYILDLGCGPGKHAIELSKEFKVTGIDIDEMMIKYADMISKEKGIDQVEFKTVNVFENPPDLKSKFDALYTLGNALMIIWTSFHVDQKEERIFNVFKSLHSVLKPKGGLFFQILNSDTPRDGHIISKITELSNGQKQMLIKHFIPVKSESKLYTTFTTIHWDDNTQPEIKSSRKGFLYLIPLDKLKNILEEVGFTDFEFFEDYSGKIFKKNSSDSLIVFCRKKEN